MSIAAKIKTEQFAEDIVQELNSVHKDDLKDMKKEASKVKKEPRLTFRDKEGKLFYSCTFCNLITTRKTNLSLHLKTKHKEVKKWTQNVVPINLPQNLKFTTVPSTSAANPRAVSITKAPSSVKVVSITKFAANVKKVASMTKSTASDKNATITKSTAKVATVTKSADYVKVATNDTSKVDHSKKTSELSAKDEVSEIVSITPISKPAKIEVKEIISFKPASTAPQKIGTLKLSQKQTLVKKNMGSNYKYNPPATLVEKKIIKSERNIWKSSKNNLFKSDTSADKCNNLHLFEYDIRPKEETMLNLLVFSKQSIPTIEEEEHKKPQEVDQNRQEKLATLVTNKFVDEDDEEEDFQCKDCLALFWFKSELYNHLREAQCVKDSELVEQKKLKVQRMKAKIQNLRILNKLKTPASEGGTKKRKHFFSLNDSPLKKKNSDVNDVEEENTDPNEDKPPKIEENIDPNEEDKSPKIVMFSNSSQHVTNGGNWIDSVKCRNDDLYRKGGPILKEGWKICFEEQKLDGRNVLVARYMLPNGKVYTRGSNGYGIPELMTDT